MDLPVAIVSGALFGLLGCVAPAALFERALRGDAPVSLAAGIAAVFVSFLSLTVVLLVVYLVTSRHFLEFGISMVVSFILSTYNYLLSDLPVITIVSKNENLRSLNNTSFHFIKFIGNLSPKSYTVTTIIHSL